MKKYKWFFAAIVLGIFALWSFCRKDQGETSQKRPFFLELPISRFSSTRCPCVDVKIEDQMLTLELDLGFRGDIALSENYLNQIGSKAFLHTQPMYDIQGNAYPTAFYRIPRMWLGEMAFLKPTLQSESNNFSENTAFSKEGSLAVVEPGRIGWELFYDVNLFVDVQNSKIAFCDHVRTLEAKGFSREDFVKIPLLLDRGLLEFEAETSKGPLRCMLDTGATWNFLNKDAGEKINHDLSDPENLSTCNFFKIGQREFGPVTFHKVAIQLPVRIEAVLGMEFFQAHLVFIDFSEKAVYLAKSR